MLDRDGALRAAEVLRDERGQLHVGFSFNGRRFQLRTPLAVDLFEHAGAGVRLDLDGDDDDMGSAGTDCSSVLDVDSV